MLVKCGGGREKVLCNAGVVLAWCDVDVVLVKCSGGRKMV